MKINELLHQPSKIIQVQLDENSKATNALSGTEGNFYLQIVAQFCYDCMSGLMLQGLYNAIKYRGQLKKL